MIRKLAPLLIALVLLSACVDPDPAAPTTHPADATATHGAEQFSAQLTAVAGETTNRTPGEK